MCEGYRQAADDDPFFSVLMQTADLLCALNLPYKVTFSYWVWLCIGTGVGCSKFVGTARYMWFVYGMIIFFIAW